MIKTLITTRFIIAIIILFIFYRLTTGMSYNDSQTFLVGFIMGIISLAWIQYPYIKKEEA